MICDVRQYWKEVRAAEAKLPAFVWLAKAGPDEAAFAVEVPAATAAQLLYAKTHRLATKAEVDAHQAREAEFYRAAQAEQRRRSGTVVVEVAPASPEPATRPAAGRRSRRS